MDTTTVQYFYAVSLFLCGLVAGSLLNTVALRWPLGIPLSSPHLCPRCNTTLQLQDRIPLFSYLLLHGKCPTCNGKIHPRYLFTELLTGICWAWAGWNLAVLPHHPALNALQGTLTLAFVSAMILVALIDYDTHTIPDAVTHIGLIVSLILAPVLPQLHHAQTEEDFSRYYPLLSYLFPSQEPWQHSIVAAVIGAMTGFGLSALIYSFGNYMFKSQIQRAKVDSALGMGDVKLMAFIGAFMGWKSVFVVFVIGAILAAGAGTLFKVYTGNAEGQTGLRRIRAKWRNGISVIPFGPFLAAAAVLFLLAGPTLEKIFGF